MLNTRPDAPASGRGIPPLQRRAELRRSGVEPPTGTIHPRNKHRAQARKFQTDAGASESSVPTLERRDEKKKRDADDSPFPPDSLAARADDFFADLVARNLSPHTLSAYRRDIAALLQVVGQSPPARVSPDDLRRALAREAADGKRPATAARRLTAWRMFFDRLIETGAATANPARGLRPPRRPSRLPKAITPDEAAKLLSPVPTETIPADGTAGTIPAGTIPADGTAGTIPAGTIPVDGTAGTIPTGTIPAGTVPAGTDGVGGSGWELFVRDAAMFELLYSSGLRVGELVALDVSDLNDEGLVRVRRGKGGRGRVAPVGSAARTALQKWRTVRAGFPGASESSALFLSRNGSRLGARSVQGRLTEWAKRAGMPGRISPHVLRHSCASHFLQSSGDLRATQELLGHRDISATQVYARLDFQTLAAVYDRSHPRARTRK